jgi:hypothetical protein
MALGCDCIEYLASAGDITRRGVGVLNNHDISHHSLEA